MNPATRKYMLSQAAIVVLILLIAATCFLIGVEVVK
jgi:hypothetical protein